MGLWFNLALWAARLIGQEEWFLEGYIILGIEEICGLNLDRRYLPGVKEEIGLDLDSPNFAYAYLEDLKFEINGNLYFWSGECIDARRSNGLDEKRVFFSRKTWTREMIQNLMTYRFSRKPIVEEFLKSHPCTPELTTAALEVLNGDLETASFLKGAVLSVMRKSRTDIVEMEELALLNKVRTAHPEAFLRTRTICILKNNGSVFSKLKNAEELEFLVFVQDPSSKEEEIDEIVGRFSEIDEYFEFLSTLMIQAYWVRKMGYYSPHLFVTTSTKQGLIVSKTVEPARVLQTSKGFYSEISMLLPTFSFAMHYFKNFLDSKNPHIVYNVLRKLDSHVFAQIDRLGKEFFKTRFYLEILRISQVAYSKLYMSYDELKEDLKIVLMSAVSDPSFVEPLEEIQFLNIIEQRVQLFQIR